MTSQAKRELSEKLAAELRTYNERLESSRNARTVPDFKRGLETPGRYCFVPNEAPGK